MLEQPISQSSMPFTKSDATMEECPLHIRIRIITPDKPEQVPQIPLVGQPCICNLLQQFILRVPPPTQPPHRPDREYEHDFERIVELDSWDEEADEIIATKRQRNVLFKTPDNIIHHESTEHHHKPSRHGHHRRSHSDHEHSHSHHHSKKHHHPHDVHHVSDRHELNHTLHNAPFVIPKAHVNIKPPSAPGIPPHIRTIPKLVKQTMRHLPARRPNIYILSFSKERAPTARAFDDLLKRHLPPSEKPMPFLYLIDASGMRVPPSQLCESYSGLSRIIQEEVMKDARARRAVRRGVFDLVDFCRKERAKEWEGGDKKVALSVCCVAGTHRSVAIGELIAQGVTDGARDLGWEEGVKIVVKHLHRVKGLKEAV